MSRRKIKPLKSIESNIDPLSLRLWKDIDFDKADSECTNCNGTGIKGYTQPTVEMKKSGVNTAIPIICRCVINNEGVQLSLLEKFAAEIKKEN